MELRHAGLMLIWTVQLVVNTESYESPKRWIRNLVHLDLESKDV